MKTNWSRNKWLAVIHFFIAAMNYLTTAVILIWLAINGLDGFMLGLLIIVFPGFIFSFSAGIYLFTLEG